MKKKSITLLCIVLCLIILQINVKFTNAQEEGNLFDQILLQTKSKTVEYGLRTSFKTTEEPKVICNYLVQSLGINSKDIKLNRSEDEKEDEYSYCISFIGENIEGYIEGLKYNNENNITINISKVENKNGLISLENKVRGSIASRSKDVKYYQYLKAKIGDINSNKGIKDIYGVNTGIIKLLKVHGALNIETVSLNNGISTIAYTKRYDAKVTNNKLIDFNYAICNYSSGLYIIIGTPEIIITY